MSTSGVSIMSSIASMTSSQRSAIVSTSWFHSRVPSRPANGSVPWCSRPNAGAESSTSVTTSRSHTSAIERTISTISASSPTVHVSRSSAAISGTPMML